MDVAVWLRCIWIGCIPALSPEQHEVRVDVIAWAEGSAARPRVGELALDLAVVAVEDADGARGDVELALVHHALLQGRTLRNGA